MSHSSRAKRVKREGHKKARQAERRAEASGRPQKRVRGTNYDAKVPPTSLPDTTCPPSRKDPKDYSKVRTCPDAPGAGRHNYIPRTSDTLRKDRKGRMTGYLVKQEICEFCGDMELVDSEYIGRRDKRKMAPLERIAYEKLA